MFNQIYHIQHCSSSFGSLCCLAIHPSHDTSLYWVKQLYHIHHSPCTPPVNGGYKESLVYQCVDYCFKCIGVFSVHFFSCLAFITSPNQWPNGVQVWLCSINKFIHPLPPSHTTPSLSCSCCSMNNLSSFRD